MKKFLAIFLLIISISIPSYAKVGDVAGQYYWTDITAVLNGSEIDSINIGGQTLISAEDMHYYSFNVCWFPNERVLDIYSIANAINGAPPRIDFKYDFKQGDIRGNYYETDIVTQLDGKEITSYNVGGRTYIHAEQMAEFGYVVQWMEQERKLFVTSPDRAGYVYDIPITEDKQKMEEGTGSFSIVYSDGKTVATGDADYFVSNLSLLRDGSYCFDMKFYQNAGLFYSTELQNKLRPLASSGYGVDVEIDPAEKFDLVNNTIKFSINGIETEKVIMQRGAGSGHQDYTFILMGLPKYKEDEIKEFKVSVGETAGEPYEIEFIKYSVNGFENSLKKYENDFIQTIYSNDKYKLIFMYESPQLGIVFPRLYVADTETREVSEDILVQVKKFEGFNTDNLSPFSFNSKGTADKIYFSCTSDEKVGDFYVDLNTKIVVLISSSNR